MQHAPIVMFVETGRCSSFDQLSAALRRTGYRTVRLTTDSASTSRFMGRMAYDESYHLDSLDELPGIADRIPSDRVVDIQCIEFALPALAAALEHYSFTEAVKARVRWRLENLDKYVVSEKLRTAGVAVPRTLPGGSSAERVGETLGWPVVIKGRVGAGGAFVRVIRSPGEFEAACSSVGGPDDAYFEEFIPGANLRYSSCRSAEGVIAEIVYTGRRRVDGYGPATSVGVIDDPRAMNLGRATLDALGGEGLANIEALQGADGTARVIDVNLRAWQSIVALGQVGPDFVAAYRRSLGESVLVVSPAKSAGTRYVDIFPDSALTAASSGSWGAAAGVFAVGVRQFFWCLGPRFILAALGLLVRTAAYEQSRVGGVIRRARQRRHVSEGHLSAVASSPR